jgi:hypothetical protein
VGYMTMELKGRSGPLDVAQFEKMKKG